MPNDMEDVSTLTVFRFIRDFIEKKGFSPTHREIARGAFLSPTSVVTHLTRLEAHGWIVREFNIPRSVHIGEYAPTEEAFDILWESAHERTE